MLWKITMSLYSNEPYPITNDFEESRAAVRERQRILHMLREIGIAREAFSPDFVDGFREAMKACIQAADTKGPY
jgi:hypothetical protein